jgi:hypothetical protein
LSRRFYAPESRFIVFDNFIQRVFYVAAIAQNFVAAERKAMAIYFGTKLLNINF